MGLLETALSQCPCGGDRGGDNGVAAMLTLLGAMCAWWLVSRFWPAGRKEGSTAMRRTAKIVVVVVLIAVVGVVAAIKSGGSRPSAAQTSPTQPSGLPRLVDLGSVTCIPCKLMAPILEDLKKTYAGKLLVEFIDVAENPDAGRPYGIKLIPTQVFFDASGKELWRHEGFISKEDVLAKWKELGVDLAGAAGTPTFSRMEAPAPDGRPAGSVCYMCDGDIDPKTLVVVQTDKGDVRLCSPHCYFILYSCLTQDKEGFEKKVSVTDWSTGKVIPARTAFYLYGLDDKTGRPTVKAFADKGPAIRERQGTGGSIVGWETLQGKELAARCGFCDRAVYPEDAALVLAEGLYTWGCCSHCAMGVAARTGKDIEVRQKDALKGEVIVVKTMNGSVASIEPKTAVAWFGLKKGPDGKFVSAGCFHQGFFINEDNLKKWVEQHPRETGKEITIAQALADKMKLTPQQIQKACKIGECAPK
jgi:thioredoxin 1